MSDILDEIISDSKEIQLVEDQVKKTQLDSIKNLIKEKTELLIRLAHLIDLAEINLKELEKDYNEKLEEVRQIWAPFLVGVDKSELDLGENKLTMENKLNVKAEDQELINNWLIENGYESVMKYQIHNQTFKKIAKELAENPACPVEIPGASYSRFQFIAVKKNKKG